MGIGDLIGSSAEFDYELFYRIMRFITTLEGLSFLDFSPPCASNDTQYKKYTLGDDHNNHCCELTSTDDTAMTLLVLLACKEYFNEKNPLSLITLSEKTMDLFFKDYLEGEKEAKTKNENYLYEGITRHPWSHNCYSAGAACAQTMEKQIKEKIALSEWYKNSRPGNSAGSGSVMRSEAYGLFFMNAPEKAFITSLFGSLTTHAHPGGALSAAAFSTLCAHWYSGLSWGESLDKTIEICNTYAPNQRVLKVTLSQLIKDAAKQGYWDSVNSGKDATKKFLHARNYLTKKGNRGDTLLESVVYAMSTGFPLSVLTQAVLISDLNTDTDTLLKSIFALKCMVNEPEEEEFEIWRRWASLELSDNRNIKDIRKVNPETTPYAKKISKLAEECAQVIEKTEGGRKIVVDKKDIEIVNKGEAFTFEVDGKLIGGESLLPQEYIKNAIKIYFEKYQKE